MATRWRICMALKAITATPLPSYLQCQTNVFCSAQPLMNDAYKIILKWLYNGIYALKTNEVRRHSLPYRVTPSGEPLHILAHRSTEISMVYKECHLWTRKEALFAPQLTKWEISFYNPPAAHYSCRVGVLRVMTGLVSCRADYKIIYLICPAGVGDFVLSPIVGRIAQILFLSTLLRGDYTIVFLPTRLHLALPLPIW